MEHVQQPPRGGGLHVRSPVACKHGQALAWRAAALSEAAQHRSRCAAALIAFRSGDGCISAAFSSFALQDLKRDTEGPGGCFASRSRGSNIGTTARVPAVSAAERENPKAASEKRLNFPQCWRVGILKTNAFFCVLTVVGVDTGADCLKTSWAHSCLLNKRVYFPRSGKY